jgi:hypothetical protein
MPEPSTTPAGVDPVTGEVEAPPVKPLSAILMEHRGGGLHNEASEELQKVVAAVKETQKKGSLTITISVEPAKDDEMSVVLMDALSAKAPRPSTKPSRWFTDDHGNVSRSDPRQPQITGLRDASRG